MAKAKTGNQTVSWCKITKISLQQVNQTAKQREVGTDTLKQRRLLTIYIFLFLAFFAFQLSDRLFRQNLRKGRQLGFNVKIWIAQFGGGGRGRKARGCLWQRKTGGLWQNSVSQKTKQPPMKMKSSLCRKIHRNKRNPLHDFLIAISSVPRASAL